MNRIGANFNRTELNNLKKAELKEDLVKESKGKTLIESATVKLVDGNIVVDKSDKSGKIAPPEHKDINPNIDNLVNGNDNLKTETEEIYNNDGTKTVKTTKTDSEGRVVSEETKTYDVSGKLVNEKTSTYEYDGMNVIRQTNVENHKYYNNIGEYTGEFRVTQVYENGQTMRPSSIKMEDIDSNGNIYGAREYSFTYYENGNIKSEKCHDLPNGIESFDSETLYDENGKVVSYHEERTYGETRWITDKEYENGVLRKEIIDASGYNNYRQEREYDENGILRKESHKEEHQGSTWSWERTYDENGNLVRKKETVEDADGNVTITTTTYNEDGSVKNTRTVHLKKRTADAMAEPREMHSRFE